MVEVLWVGAGLQLHVAAAGFELAGDEVLGGLVEHGGSGAAGDGGGEFLGVEHGYRPTPSADDHPAGENQERRHRNGAAELDLEVGGEPLGLAEGLVEAVVFLAPGISQGAAVVDDLVGHETDPGAAFAAGFGLDGEDAGRADHDVVEVEGRGGGTGGRVAGGHVVKHAVAGGFEGFEVLGDDALAEEAETGVAAAVDHGDDAAGLEHHEKGEGQHADADGNQSPDVFKPEKQLQAGTQGEDGEEQSEQGGIEDLFVQFPDFALQGFTGAAEQAGVFREGGAVLARAVSEPDDQAYNADKKRHVAKNQQVGSHVVSGWMVVAVR